MPITVPTTSKPWDSAGTPRRTRCRRATPGRWPGRRKLAATTPTQSRRGGAPARSILQALSRGPVGKSRAAKLSGLD